MSRKLPIDEIVATAARVRRMRRAVEWRQRKVTDDQQLTSWVRLRRWEQHTWRRHFFWLTLEEGMALAEMLQAYAFYVEDEGGGSEAYDAAGHLGDAADCLSSAADQLEMAA